MTEANAVLARLVGAVHAAASFLTTASSRQPATTKLSAGDRHLLDEAAGAACRMDAALRQDFDVPAALAAAVALASSLSTTLRAASDGVSRGAVAAAADTVVSFAELVGLPAAVGWRAALRAAAAPAHGGAPTTTLADAAPLAQALAHFRTTVRVDALAALAATKRDGGGADVRARIAAVLTECDRVRDAVLPSLGWRLADGAHGSTVLPAGAASNKRT